MSSLKKIIWISLYLAFHLLILSEARTSLFKYQIGGIREYAVNSNSELTINRIDTRIIDFDYPKKIDSAEKVWTYKIPFGFFFLLGIIGMILVGSDRRYYIVLLTAHFVVLLLASLVFYLSINVNTWLLVINDLLTRYFIPVISIGAVAFALLEKRE
ncbi:MAG: hypothetical protein U5K71_12365 [Gracilimonas sp.]|nr:hypothetical protein [Gracilimonas sp.]